MDPGAVYVEAGVTVGAGTLLLPGTILRGNTMVGENCEIGPNTMLTDCTVGDGAVINSSQCNESTIESGAHVAVSYTHLIGSIRQRGELIAKGGPGDDCGSNRGQRNLKPHGNTDVYKRQRWSRPPPT